MKLKAMGMSVLIMLLLSACLPRLQGPTPLPDTEAARQISLLAQEAFHRMAIGKLQTGSYTPNVLVDLKLPRGSLWTLESLGSDSYQLRFISDEVMGYAWLVSPVGVQFITVSN